MTPLRWVDIDTAAIADNFRSVQRLVGESVPVTAVVKSDAYGHGAAAVARACFAAGARGAAVTYLEEALALRRAKVAGPLLVMGPVDPVDADRVARAKVAVMVDNRPLLDALNGRGRRSPIPVHLKIDLGLRRWGVPLSAAAEYLREIAARPGVRLEGVFAHPGYMIHKNAGDVERALRDFVSALRPRLGAFPKARLHAADSAVLLDFPEFRLQGVRVGNLLYGMNPTDKPLELRNPWFPRTRVVRITHVRAGESVGYGGLFVAEKDMTLGTLPVGYSHGFALELAPARVQPYWVTVNGARCPVVGRVGMSHTTIDLSALPAPREGDVAALPLRRTASAQWEKIHR